MDAENGRHLSAFEFFEKFPDEASAIAYFEEVRWPYGVICPRCNSDRTTPVKNRPRHHCNGCGRQFSVRTGILLENSRIPVRKWLYAIYIFQIHRKGISSVQLGKELGISQHSAWFMLHRLREAMIPDLEQLKSEVEIDEAWVGGLEKNKHSKKRLYKKWVEGKQIVLGMRQRDGGPIVLRPIPTNTQEMLINDILLSVKEGSVIYTDEFVGYFNLGEHYDHFVINHQKGEYVNEHITTNSIESVWAILKRAHKGIYHQWSKKHGHRYYNEIAYRLTEGRVDIPIMVRIRKLTQKTFEVQLTYKELTK
ncbi:MAG: IS1595 family transposase [Caldilineaceae bacterium]|nr:IS1595 family transposase [Caldilineaceae bacterium]